jgi:hypothetical protein
LEKWWHYVWGKERTILGWSENQFVIKFYHLRTLSLRKSLCISVGVGEKHLPWTGTKLSLTTENNIL